LGTTTIPDKEYIYDPSLTNTEVAKYSDWITETLFASCPILTCRILQSDCSTALVDPFDTVLSIDTGTPWALRIS